MRPMKAGWFQAPSFNPRRTTVSRRDGMGAEEPQDGESVGLQFLVQNVRIPAGDEDPRTEDFRLVRRSDAGHPVQVIDSSSAEEKNRSSEKGEIEDPDGFH